MKYLYLNEIHSKAQIIFSRPELVRGVIFANTDPIMKTFALTERDTNQECQRLYFIVIKNSVKNNSIICK